MEKVYYLCEPSAGKKALGEVEIDGVFDSDGKEVYSEFFNFSIFAVEKNLRIETM